MRFLWDFLEYSEMCLEGNGESEDAAWRLSLSDCLFAAKILFGDSFGRFSVWFHRK